MANVAPPIQYHSITPGGRGMEAWGTYPSALLPAISLGLGNLWGLSPLV